MISGAERTVRIKESDLKKSLHVNYWGYIPDKKVYERLLRIFSDYESQSFFGLREESARFFLSLVLRNIQWQIEDETETGPKKDISEAVDYVRTKAYDEESLSPEILKERGWSEERGRSFLRRSAAMYLERIASLLPKEISQQTIDEFVQDFKKKIELFYTRKERVAEEYLIQMAQRNAPMRKLPHVEPELSQSDSDKAFIEGQRRKTQSELFYTVLSTVRSNTERVRLKIIPQLIRDGADSQTAFWAIHSGELGESPAIAQMLSNEANAEIGVYVSSVGEKFYEQNTGSPRKIRVGSANFSHLDPHYLAEIQGFLFEKTDSTKTLSENQFISFATQTDVIMYILHLPFDASGRTIEDYIVYLSTKHGFPLTLSVLGYREAGSPVLPKKEEVGPRLKAEINAWILRRLGIEARGEKSYKESIEALMNKYSLSENLANIVFYSEMTILTHEMIEKLGDEEYDETLSRETPSYSSLREIWKSARNLSFIPIPEKNKEYVDGIVSGIGIDPEDTSQTSNLLERVRRMYKMPNPAPQIAKYLESYIKEKRKTSEDSDTVRFWERLFKRR